MKNYLGIFILAFTVLLSACSDDDGNAPDTMMDAETPEDTTEDLTALTMTNVSYGDDPQQVYDIYLPAGRKASKTKTIVLIHGGGWTSGDKEDMEEFLVFVQENNPDHAVVNINYVLADPIAAIPAFPNQYEDVQKVIEQLTEQQEELQIKAEFGMLGASAGAHLAMMYDYVYDTTDQVKFVIDIVGPSDFTDPFYADDPNFDIALALFVDESQYPDGTDYAEANSPALQVTTSSSPTLLFYGNMDPLVPLSNGMRLDEALNASNTTHLLTVYEGGHGNDWSDASVIDLVDKSNNYIATYLSID